MKPLPLLFIFVAGCYAAQTRNFDIVTIIRSRFSETIISSSVYNNKKEAAELKFQTILPNEAFITSFSMAIDGQIYDGVIEEKVEAEKVYERLRAKNKTTGIVRTRDESIKTFKTSVNVGAGKVVEFKLVYVQILQRHLGKYLNRIILLGSQLTHRLSINVFIAETSRITNVTVPAVITPTGQKINPNVSIEIEGKYAHIKYNPRNANDPLLQALYGNGGSFTTEYTLDVQGAGDIVVDKDYFIHFFDPNANKDAPPQEVKRRRIMFVLDTSGSMSGHKLNQLKIAIVNVLSELTPQDRFGILDFDSGNKLWDYNGAKITYATPDAVSSAMQFVRRMSDDGGTDIQPAIQGGMDEIQYDVEHSQGDWEHSSNYIVFLTDGQDYNWQDFVERLSTKNKFKIAIHSIGLGSDVNVEFLKMLAARNYGSWVQIFEDVNVAVQIQNFMTSIGRYAYLPNDLEIIYPKFVEEKIMTDRSKMLEGGELVTIGKFKPRSRGKHPGNHVITVKQYKKPSFNLTFSLSDRAPTLNTVGARKIQNYVRKAFGIVKVNEVLVKMDSMGPWHEEEKQRLKREAINISKEFELVTPVTAMIVVTPEDQAELDKEDKEAKNAEDEDDTSISANKPKQLQKPWWSSNGDPHFLTRINEEITACFNWRSQDGEIYNLLLDPKNNIVVNGKLSSTGPEHHNATFISTIVTILRKYNLAITITSENLTITNLAEKDERLRNFVYPVRFTDPYVKQFHVITLQLSNITRSYSLLTLTIEDNVSFVIDIHNYENASSKNHLDFVIGKTRNLGNHLHGIFGSLPKEEEHDSAKLFTKKGRQYLWLQKNRLTFPVEKREMYLPAIKSKVPCWFVRKTRDILGYHPSYFLVESLLSIPHYLLE